MCQTNMYESLLAETISLPGHNGQVINAYFARPLGTGPFPGMVLVHHMPGWDEWHKETTLRFARMGYATLCPNLYYRTGHGTPEDVAAKARAASPTTRRLATWRGRRASCGPCPMAMARLAFSAPAPGAATLT